VPALRFPCNNIVADSGGGDGGGGCGDVQLPCALRRRAEKRRAKRGRVGVRMSGRVGGWVGRVGGERRVRARVILSVWQTLGGFLKFQFVCIAIFRPDESTYTTIHIIIL